MGLWEKLNVGTAYKVSLVSLVVIMSLLITGILFSLRRQDHLSKTIIDSYSKSQKGYAEQEESSRKEYLQNFIENNADICTKFSSSFVYNFDKDNLRKLFVSFLKNSEIVAVEVYDERDKPFVAVWKNGNINMGDSFPASFSREKYLHIERPIVHETFSVGKLYLYYTDEFLYVESLKKQHQREAGVREFKSITNKSIGQATRVQISIAVFILLFLVFLIFISIQTIRIIDNISRERELESKRAGELAEKANQANRAKSFFLANMSHEIRTPMNGVIGMLDLLISTKGMDDEQMQYAQIARQSGESLLYLINDILDFSKIEAGKMEIESIDFELRALMDNVASTFVFKIEERALEFVSFVQPDVPVYIKGDPGRLKQVLINLMSNAVKFTKRGGISLTCELVEEFKDSWVLRFSVHDTGIGISKDKQKLLFKKFTQADGSTTREYGGTGLGLAISKELVNLMGGSIHVESPLSDQHLNLLYPSGDIIGGDGATFTFTIKPEKSSRQSKMLAPSTTKEIRVLYIDALEDNLISVSQILSKWHVTHTTITDATKALPILEDGLKDAVPFTVVLLGKKSGSLSALKFAKLVRKDEKFQGLHLVYLTSKSHRGELSQYKKEGFAAFLTTPISQVDLYQCLLQITADESISDSSLTQSAIITRHSIHEDRRANASILLVEDNSINRIVALSILKKLGYHADYAVDGFDAIEKLKEKKYDLVFMDLQMPKMGGLEATKIIRDPQSDVTDHHIPIIAMTANAMTGDRENCIEAGMSDYLSKPIKPDTVYAILERWIDYDSDKELHLKE